MRCTLTDGLCCAAAGSDALGWAMYIDGSRSWFVHGGAHGGRAGGGIARGAAVGVLLDLTRGTLRFTVDDRPQVTTTTYFRVTIVKTIVIKTIVKIVV